jgi:hypothetical protein
VKTQAPTFMIAERPELSDSGSSTLEVQLPGGASTRVLDSVQVQLLAQLLRQLA